MKQSVQIQVFSCEIEEKKAFLVIFYLFEFFSFFLYKIKLIP